MPVMAAAAALFAATLAWADETPPDERPDVLPKAKIYQQTLHGTAMIVRHTKSNKPGVGTAWVIDKKNCLLVTNDHVVDGTERLSVYFPMHRRGLLMTEAEHYLKKEIPLEGWVVDSMPEKDLAVIRVAALPTHVRELELVSPEHDIQPGEEAFSIGNPPGTTASLWIFTTGTVRQIMDADFHLASGQTVRARCVEAQSPINPGDSGGPVVNERGEVVAVVESFEQGQRLRSLFIHASEVRDYMKSVRKWLDPTTAEELYERGKNYLEKGRYQQALNDFDEAVNIEPKNAEYILARGEARFELTDYDAAATDFSEALKLKSDLEMALCLRGWCNAKKGQSRSATEDFTDALALNPRLGRAYAGRAQIEIDNEKYDKAIDEFTTAIRHEPAVAQYYEGRGDLYFRSAQDFAAVKDYTEAMRIAGTKPALLRKRADAWRDFGLFKEALADYDQALKYNSEDADAYLGRALLRFRDRQFDKSLVDIDAAIANSPKSAILRVHKGNILLVAGQDKEANRAYEQAAAIDARVLAENRYRDLQSFDRRGLYVINRTTEPIRFHVLFFTRTGTDPKSDTYWYPGAPGTERAKLAQTWEVEPGSGMQPVHKFSDTNTFPVRGSKVRIWGEGVNSGRKFVTYKDQDLNLVPEGTYKQFKEERYLYSFE